MFNREKVKAHLSKAARSYAWDNDDEEKLATDAMVKFHIPGNVPPDWLMKMARDAINEKEDTVPYDWDEKLRSLRD